jgi:light-regulated signal transduction histidine kinase (bacteriophytochrome)
MLARASPLQYLIEPRSYRSTAERCAEARRLTGFDRVMIYRFLRDGSGSVVAEDKAEALARSSITATPPRTSPSKRVSFICET